jgi:hypothetical protein
VQVLWKRQVEQGVAGEAEALRILREYWLRHVTSEDALRPLLELLGKREWYSQAKEYYERLCVALDLEGKQPDQRTRDIMEFQQAVQIQRKRTRVDSNGGDENVQRLSASLPKEKNKQRSNAGQREYPDIHFFMKDSRPFKHWHQEFRI